MRAVSRVKTLLLAAALATLPAAGAAQEAPPTTNSTTTNGAAASPPPSDVVGPRELRNFSLPGTVTRQADQPRVTVPAEPRPRAVASRPSRDPAAGAPAPAPTKSRPPSPKPTAPRQATATPDTSSPPPQPNPFAGQNAAVPAPTASFPTAADTAAPPASNFSIPLFAWLLAAVLLGAAGALLFRRNRAREALAGGPDEDFFEPVPLVREAAPAVEPAAPAPEPSPPPPAPVPPPSAGVVSTRLRPWLDIGFGPVRCVLDEARLTVDFEVELVNSGSAPARDVHLDAAAFNAGPTQDALLAAFFERPMSRGEPVDPIGPLERRRVPLQLTIPRDQLQPYQLNDQQVFVPVIALNALFRWSSGDGQTAASYLLGRGTGSDKIAPFKFEAGSRSFDRLAAKILPAAVRR